MRDFLPGDMILREWVMDKIKLIFKKYGYEPLETPALEYWDILSGKYGEEEKLIYRFKDYGGREIGLRYDHTVPLARVITMHRDIPMPFRCYQLSPAWRADKPQKGRYREFYQCDVDIVGTDSIFADAEIILITYEILHSLGFENFRIRINNRKILKGMIHYANIEPDKEFFVYRTIDKIDKIGKKGMVEELEKGEIKKQSIDKLISFLSIYGNLENIFARLETIIDEKDGILELRDLFSYLKSMEIPSGAISLDLSLARGLDYYTGPIYETIIEKPAIGSITGGGRYNKLIELFSGVSTPACGTTIGFERILDVMKELAMFPEIKPCVEVLVTLFDKSTLAESIKIAKDLRKNEILTELYPESVKLSKQFKFADRKGIPWVIVVGPDELREGNVTVKDMKLGKQEKVEREKIVEYIIKMTKSE
jgi:histidyl-tRNA synthetase